MEWHYDGMHQKTPNAGAILWAGAVPSRGGLHFGDHRCATIFDQ
jgi:hypothetical protein